MDSRPAFCFGVAQALIFWLVSLHYFCGDSPSNQASSRLPFRTAAVAAAPTPTAAKPKQNSLSLNDEHLLLEYGDGEGIITGGENHDKLPTTTLRSDDRQQRQQRGGACEHLPENSWNSRRTRSSGDSDDNAGDAQFILLLNGNVYTPTSIGKAHVLVAGTSIVAIFRNEDFPWVNLLPLSPKVFDVNGSLVIPGFIDIHVHITGGGGEAGPASRTPESGLSDILNAGITTLVGTLGTDCVSRSLENLLAKTAALKDEGLTAYMWSGCYRVPSPTLTGSLVRDLQLVEQVIGAGEIAISDHRGSWPSSDELMKLVSDARVGGMLSGKAGIVHFHTGAAMTLLDPLWDVINVSRGAIPIAQMLPTHISSRGAALLEAAEAWIRAGGHVDFTADQEGESDSFAALMEWARKGTVPLGQVSISSDGFGSLPLYDAQGKLLKYGIASAEANLNTIRQLVFRGGWAFEQALPLSTINPAKFLSFQKKGKLEVGMDADVVVLDAEHLRIQYVIAMGKLMKTPTWTKTNMFGF